MTLWGEHMIHKEFSELSTKNPRMKPYMLILLTTFFDDKDAAAGIREYFSTKADVEFITNYVDWRGNNILWYLTYRDDHNRDDQNAQGGFACPYIERELLWLGADPNRRNNIGLCWNDVRRHLIRSEV